MNNVFRFVFLCVVWCLASCSDEEPGNTAANFLENGVLVVNQGSFGSGTGTLSFINKSDYTIISDVYSSANSGNVLGNVTQSISEIDDHFVVTINNGSKVILINKEDFSFAREINGIDQPRYSIQHIQDDFWLTSWGADGVSGSIRKIDGASGDVLENFNVGGGPERMAWYNTSLYVTNSGGFFRDSVVHKITNNAIEKDIVVGDNPTDLIVDGDNNLWVLCAGYTDFVDPANSTAGRLVKLVNDEVVEAYDLDNGASQLEISSDGQSAFYVAGGKVWSFNLDTGNSTEIYSGFFYYMGVDKSDGSIYLADAKDFVSNGEILQINENGDLQRSFDAGVIPGYLHFID